MGVDIYFYFILLQIFKVLKNSFYFKYLQEINYKVYENGTRIRKNNQYRKKAY